MSNHMNLNNTNNKCMNIRKISESIEGGAF